ncbi:hypothetical protein FB45DRAFT_864623 [Roridomyces roridus]|uniref:Uncharacterized protein n=1 Tax=Roridomyces roridus TaxID=1738132 RepID=A0AAD7C1H9_9AGAR|nr:hypothetical protein FB45DRAFT_864623 [Roridomyces roridus]
MSGSYCAKNFFLMKRRCRFRLRGCQAAVNGTELSSAVRPMDPSRVGQFKVKFCECRRRWKHPAGGSKAKMHVHDVKVNDKEAAKWSQNAPKITQKGNHPNTDTDVIEKVRPHSRGKTADKAELKNKFLRLGTRHLCMAFAQMLKSLSDTTAPGRRGHQYCVGSSAIIGLAQHLAGYISADAKMNDENVMARKNQKLGHPIETCT